MIPDIVLKKEEEDGLIKTVLLELLLKGNLIHRRLMLKICRGFTT